MEALQRLHNRGSISTGYNIDNSLKFEEDNLELLYKTFSGEGTGAGRTFTISAWCKRTELGGIDIVFGFGRDANDYGDGGFRINSDQLQLASFPYSGGVDSYNIRSTAVFRDTSAWYHFMAAVDTTQGTASNRVRLYVNGTEITDFTTSDYPAQNFQWKVGRAEEHMIGNRPDTSATEGAGFSTQNFSGYMAEFHFVDGQQLAASDFGEFDEDTGIWKPKAYTGSYGTNGFYLKFNSAGSLGADSSGNGNNFTLNNITSADQATDTSTNNFATWNVIADTRLPSDADRIYFNEGATQPIKSTGTGWTTVVSTQAFSSGKWYWEGEVERQDGATMWGCYPTKTREVNVYLNSYIGGSESSGFDSGCAFYDNDDAYYYDNTSTACTISGGTVQTVAGDIIMIAIDMDNNKFYAGRNGQWFNSSDNTHANATGITLSDEEHFFAFAAYHPSRTYKTNLGGYTTISISSAASDANGYGNFEYAPPSGYYALCTKNLAEYGG